MECPCKYFHTAIFTVSATDCESLVYIQNTALKHTNTITQSGSIIHGSQGFQNVSKFGEKINNNCLVSVPSLHQPFTRGRRSPHPLKKYCIIVISQRITKGFNLAAAIFFSFINYGWRGSKAHCVFFKRQWNLGLPQKVMS